MCVCFFISQRNRSSALWLECNDFTLDKVGLTVRKICPWDRAANIPYMSSPPLLRLQSSVQPLSKTIQQPTALQPPPQIHQDHINHPQSPRLTLFTASSLRRHITVDVVCPPGCSLLCPGWRCSQSLARWVVVWHLLQLRIILACVLAHTHSHTCTHTVTPFIRPAELMTEIAGL